ncbi:hypothetical protein [Paenibacillus herberti]|uniref:Uncharacterized protein n=1 Tax=Paenibacillus herberti TaxID=1619309 RepID=A0A229NUY0_9BACL|nr:hypothetical protein [Paenibacillus herberti]OXM13419.1 hypothetical protein CGZ75_20410 [Paenibacillus herberti]
MNRCSAPGLIWLIAVIFLFISLYGRKEREEPYLLLKLIGYFLLGGFIFYLNSIPIPVGFIIYWLALHGKPKPNRVIKESAAVWGVGLQLIQLFLRLIF